MKPTRTLRSIAAHLAICAALAASTGAQAVEAAGAPGPIATNFHGVLDFKPGDGKDT